MRPEGFEPPTSNGVRPAPEARSPARVRLQIRHHPQPLAQYAGHAAGGFLPLTGTELGARYRLRQGGTLEIETFQP